MCRGRHLRLTQCALFFVSLTVAGAGQVLAASPEKTPIRIGFIAPLTGAFAQNGKDMLDGFTLSLDEIGFSAAGRRIELVTEDDEGKPQVSLTKVQKMVEHNGVHLLAGNLLANTEYALIPLLERLRVPMVFPQLRSDDIAQRMRPRWAMGTGPSVSQHTHPFGEYAYKVLGYRKVSAIGLDYAFGYEVVGGFQRTFEELGGQIVQKIWAPIASIDFAPYIALVRRDVDAVFAVFSGRSALQFVRQYKEAGLKERLPLIGTGIMTDEHVLRTMGDEALGIVTPLFYAASLDTPSNRRFAQAVRAKTGKTASVFHAGSYTAARWLVEGIKQVQGEVEDRVTLMAALRRIETQDDPRGPIKLDPYSSPIVNIYIRKVERVGGELQNTVIHTYPTVSQFWTYKPEEFLKQPVYSRDFPPCRFC